MKITTVLIELKQEARLLIRPHLVEAIEMII